MKRAKLAVTLTFITNGLSVGSFVARLPDIKVHLNISNGTLGTFILSSSVGVFVALRPAGKLCAIHGSAPIAFLGTLGLAISNILLGFVFNSAWFCFSLFLFGFSLAVQDVSMNSHAVTLEHQSKARMMSTFHGMFSLGALLGGAIGGLFSQLNLSFEIQTFIFSSVVGSIAFYSKPRWLAASFDKHELHDEIKIKRRPRVLWILGLFGFCSALSEGAAGDWGGILARETFHSSHFVSALPFVSFSATMVLGRFFGDRLANKFGAPLTLSAGGAIASFGLALGLLFGGSYGVVIGWLFLGSGLSIVVPLVFSAAGTISAKKFSGQIAPSQAVAFVSGISYFGFIVGPPLMGFLADAIQLRWAMFIPVFLVALLVFSARFAKTD